MCLIIDPTDARSLHEAVREHDNVVLGAGVYEIEGPLRLAAGGHLVGLGTRATTVRLVGAHPTIVIESGGEVVIRAVQIESKGAAVLARSGAVRIEQCEIDADTPLTAEGDAHVRAVECSLIAGGGPAVRASADAVVLLVEGQVLGGAEAVDRATLSLRQCEITNAAGDGVRALGRAQVELDRSRVRGCGGCGIRVTGRAHALLRGGDISGHADAGIEVAGHAGAAAEGVAVHTNASDGVRAGGWSVLAVDGCDVHDNRASGIAVLERADGEVVHNRCTGNARFGVWVGDQARAEVRGNTCTGNGAVGIALTEVCSARVMGNEASANGWFALHADPAVTVTARANTLVERQGAADEWVLSRDDDAETPLAPEWPLPEGLAVRDGTLHVAGDPVWRLLRVGAGDLVVRFVDWPSAAVPVVDGAARRLRVQRVGVAARYRSPLVRRHLDRHIHAAPSFSERPVAALDWPGVDHWTGPHLLGEGGASYVVLLPLAPPLDGARAAVRARIRAGERPAVRVVAVRDVVRRGDWLEETVVLFVLDPGELVDAYAERGEPMPLSLWGDPEAVALLDRLA